MTTMSTRIDGKVVLLTGATGGLGSATARRIADEGGHLVLTDLDVAACE
ncbi:MAG: short chain dehydrogenase, partial [Nocardioidaceae bacterium]|nr:short chain dehydrogenase [Nocardioidaceae bacterium]